MCFKLRFTNYQNRLILLICVISINILRLEANDIWIEPELSYEGQPKVLVFLPGARVKPENYEDLMLRIQREAHQPLWIVILRFLGDVPQPLRLKERVENTLRAFSRRLNISLNSDDVWISGHSLGGINARRIASSYGGLILMSSYFDRLSDRNKSDFATFNKPVLMLSGELDGLTRPAYLVRDLNHATTNSDENNWSKGVLLLPKVNHSLFAYDEILLSGDLPTNLDPAAGRNLVAKTVASFMTYNSQSSSNEAKAKSLEYLISRKNDSVQLTQPYLDAMVLDQNLCESAQDFFINQSFDNEIAYAVTPKTVDQVYSFALAKPGLSLNEAGKPIIETIQFNDNYRNILDRGNISLAPKSTFCKMKSAEAIADLMWTSIDYQQPSCFDYQKLLLERTLSYLSEIQKEKYLGSDKTLTLRPEIKHNTGISWLSSRSALIDSQRDEYFVRNQALYTGLTAPSRFAGMQYCRLVSATRLLDWYLIDALQKDSN